MKKSCVLSQVNDNGCDEIVEDFGRLTKKNIKKNLINFLCFHSKLNKFNLKF